MKPIAGFAFFTLASFLSLVSACGTNAETDARESVLINNAKAFADAFQKGDAKAVSAFWAEDGDYVDDSAHRFEGRVASYEHLRGLEWAVGDWADEEDGPEVSLVTFGGKKLSATNVVTRNGPDVITWQSKDRTLDGETLPDAKQITMKRVPLTTLH